MKMTKLLTTFMLFLVVLFVGCKNDDYIEKVGVCFQVIATDPMDLERSIAYDKTVFAAFNAKVDTSTLDEFSFTLQQGSTLLDGRVSHTDSTATFTPDLALLPFTEYTGTIKMSVKSSWGNALQQDYVWTFTTMPQLLLVSNPLLGGNTSGGGAFPEGTDVTATASPLSGYTFVNWTENGVGVSSNPNFSFQLTANKTLVANFILAVGGTNAGPGEIDLGGSALYTVLSKAGISTTGVTSITGNIGVSPYAATGITGFGLIMDPSNMFSKSSPSSLVSGNVYAANYAAPTPALISTAVSDMESAFTTANNKTLSVITELGAGNITGKVLAPGLYKWGTGLLISSSGVTLSGGANDTWIFQVGQGMTVENGAHITLAGGALAKNIYWIIASNVMIGTTVHFNGNILSMTEISVNTGSTVTGRLLGQTAVTLNAATIILP